VSRTVDGRPTSWWLSALRRRASHTPIEPELQLPVEWVDDQERRAAWRFFNAALRAEESGLRQAHELSAALTESDPELCEVLRLYGDEEGWHRELLTEFLAHLGGEVQPMGRVTKTLYRIYGRAERMETIVLTNLMFETIGSTTYRLALRNVRQPATRRMLAILTRDEAFHVPLNVHFLRRVLAGAGRKQRLRLLLVQRLLFLSLVALPLASRPKAFAFDRIPAGTLARAYARELAAVFAEAPDLGLPPPWALLLLLGVRRSDLRRAESMTSEQSAERAVDRQSVAVAAL